MLAVAITEQHRKLACAQLRGEAALQDRIAASRSAAELRLVDRDESV
jgi:hypothetical protein